MITAIEKIKKTNKYMIFYDGQATGALSAGALLLARLAVGQKIEKKELKRLIAEGERADALNDLLSVLSRFSLTESKAERKLAAKGYSESAVGYAIARAKEYGYIDDLEYARHHIQVSIRNKGKKRIREELRLKGIESELIDGCLETVEEYDGCKIALATLLRIKKVESPSALVYAEKVKIVRSLLYKGFDYDTIKQALADFDCGADI